MVCWWRVVKGRFLVRNPAESGEFFFFCCCCLIVVFCEPKCFSNTVLLKKNKKQEFRRIVVNSTYRMSLSLSVRLSLFPFLYLSDCLSSYFSFCQTVCLDLSLFVRLSVLIFLFLADCLSAPFSTYLSG